MLRLVLVALATVIALAVWAGLVLAGTLSGWGRETLARRAEEGSMLLGKRRAVVVGASRGVGRAIALGLAREGARVLAVARSATALTLDASGDDAPELVSQHTIPDLIVICAGAWRHYSGFRLEPIAANPSPVSPRIRAMARCDGRIRCMC